MLLEPVYARVTLQQSGDTLNGSWGIDSLRGSVKGTSIDITLTEIGGHEAGAVTGLITGDSGEGTGTMTGLGRRGAGTANGRPPMPQEVQWKLTRELVPPASPRRSRMRRPPFRPTTMRVTLSRTSHRPASSSIAGEATASVTAFRSPARTFEPIGKSWSDQRHAAFTHHLLEIAIADAIAAVSSHRPKDDLALETTPLEL